VTGVWYPTAAFFFIDVRVDIRNLLLA